MFKVGDIITGKGKKSYSITTDDALMLVTETDRKSMTVRILYHVYYSSEVDSDYSVKNSQDEFRHITIKEFKESHPMCYKMEATKLKRLLSEYSERYENEIEEDPAPYVLSAEMRKELLEEMRTLLVQYHYQPTDMGLNRILDEWCKNKADLIRLFEKHPNYNGKFQIAFDYDFSREIDKSAVRKFTSWLRSKEVQDCFLKEVKIGAFTYEELCFIYNKLSDILSCFQNSNIKAINGKTKEEYLAECKHFRTLYKTSYEENENVHCTWNAKAYDMKLYAKWSKITEVRSLLGSYNLGQFVTEELETEIRRCFPEAKIKKGQRTSRAINKILTMLGVDKLPNYNKEFAKFADAINPLKIRRHTVISIHPVDYYTMSFGNSWASCHTIDKLNDRGIDGNHTYSGCYSSGTESYMLDGTSCVFYTVSADYNGNNLELESKINRCMFHYYDGQLVQGRVYPQTNDTGANNLYRDIREVAQKVFADILEVPNYWTIKTGTEACESVTSSDGTHYRDYENYSTCNVSTLKDDRKDHAYILIGHDPICPHCGETHYREDNIQCNDCTR